MAGRRGAVGGFTLVEMATALLIVALAVAVAVPAYRSLSVEDDLTRATRRVETLFRMARDSAIGSGRPVTVVVDSLAGLVWIDAREPLGLEAVEVRAALAYPEEGSQSGIVLPAALRAGPEFEQGAPIGLPATVRLELLRARASFTFLPGGGALGDTLVLDGAMGMRVITLDPWTGEVLVR